jgi:hypothetical protein
MAGIKTNWQMGELVEERYGCDIKGIPVLLFKSSDSSFTIYDIGITVREYVFSRH